MNDDHLGPGDRSVQEQPSLISGAQRPRRQHDPLTTGPAPIPPIAQGPNAVGWWARLLDGDNRWGSMERSTTRYGVTQYWLVVFPPGIDRGERRLLRGWRGWPGWGFGLWLLTVCLGAPLGPWARFTLPAIVWLGIGLWLFARVGALRTQVRTLHVTRIAGDPDERSAAAFAEMKTLATLLRTADRLHAQGALSASGHEAIWWQVYDRLSLGAPRAW